MMETNNLFKHNNKDRVFINLINRNQNYTITTKIEINYNLKEQHLVTKTGPTPMTRVLIKTSVNHTIISHQNQHASIRKNTRSILFSILLWNNFSSLIVSYLYICIDNQQKIVSFSKIESIPRFTLEILNMNLKPN